VPAHVGLGNVDVFDVDSDRVGAFATALMPFEYASRVQPGNTRDHRKSSPSRERQMSKIGMGCEACCCARRSCLSGGEDGGGGGHL
jgi:hypothetical protein